jgi:hypothetical protein
MYEQEHDLYVCDVRVKWFTDQVNLKSHQHECVLEWSYLCGVFKKSVVMDALLGDRVPVFTFIIEGSVYSYKLGVTCLSFF